MAVNVPRSIINANRRRPPARIHHDGFYWYWTGDDGVYREPEVRSCDVGKYEREGAEPIWFDYNAGTPVGPAFVLRYG